MQKRCDLHGGVRVHVLGRRTKVGDLCVRVGEDGWACLLWRHRVTESLGSEVTVGDHESHQMPFPQHRAQQTALLLSTFSAYL